MIFLHLLSAFVAGMGARLCFEAVRGGGACLNDVFLRFCMFFSMALVDSVELWLKMHSSFCCFGSARSIAIQTALL